MVGEVGGMVVRKVGAIRMMVFRKQHFVLVNAKKYSKEAKKGGLR